MHRSFISASMLLLATSIAAAQPTTAPATVESVLMKGAMRYDVPADWKEAQRADDGNLVSYNLPGGIGMCILQIGASDQPYTKAMRQPIAAQITKGMEAGLNEYGHEIVKPPAWEPDDNYFLRITSAYRIEGAKLPTIHVALYRSLGLTLASVTTTLTTNDVTLATENLKTAAAVMDSFRAGKPIKPSGFPRARVWITSPLEWLETKTDTLNGPLATYKDPRDSRAQIRVGVRTLTKEAKADAGVRQKLVDALLTERDAQLTADGYATHADLDPPAAGAFLQRTKSTFQGKEDQRLVESRLLQVGDALLLVTSISGETGAKAVVDAADVLASGIKLIERK